MTEQDITNRVNDWIATQHGTAGWEQKLINLVADMVLEEAAAKNNAYTERNRLVSALSKIYPAHLAEHEANDPNWDPEWMWIVFITLPAGQASWHIHNSELPLFSHLRVKPNKWDGHTTEEKYARLDAIKPSGHRRKFDPRTTPLPKQHQRFKNGYEEGYEDGLKDGAELEKKQKDK